ncbi:MAG: transposase [Oscillospiraceae bacterium]|nr:transposase [Oscillospiraceae bacterium]
MADFPQRKRIRLYGYDYSGRGYYFITICTKNRNEILSTIPAVGANCVRPILTEIGRVVEKEIAVLSAVYADVEIENFVIMPNHIHMILAISPDGRTQFAPTVSRIIKQFKGSITKRISFPIWQTSFHDRIIRNENEYKNIYKYIDENSVLWQADIYNPQNSPKIKARDNL